MLTRRSILAGAPAAALLPASSLALERASPQARIDFHWCELRKALAEHKGGSPEDWRALAMVDAQGPFQTLGYEV